MKRTLLIGKDQHEVELVRQDGVTTLRWNGGATQVDLLEVEPGCYSIVMDGKSVDVRLDAGKHPDPDVHAYRATVFDGAYEFALQDPMKALLAAAGGVGATGGTLTAPMPGKIVKVLVGPGDTVTEGQTLLIMEAMKMQNELKATGEGLVAQVAVAEGATVETGALLIGITSKPAE